jgi:hypothetical protein
MVTRISELVTTLAVTSSRRTLMPEDAILHDTKALQEREISAQPSA